MQRTVSFETAKKLKECGWSTNTDWAWYRVGGYDNPLGLRICDIKLEGYDIDFLYFAPDFMELWEALPKTIETADGWLAVLNLTKREQNNQVFAFYESLLSEIDPWWTESENPIDALALLWIELKKKGIVE